MARRQNGQYPFEMTTTIPDSMAALIADRAMFSPFSLLFTHKNQYYNFQLSVARPFNNINDYQSRCNSPAQCSQLISSPFYMYVKLLVVGPTYYLTYHAMTVTVPNLRPFSWKKFTLNSILPTLSEKCFSNICRE